MMDRTTAPVPHLAGERRRQVQLVVSLREPDQAAVRGQPSTVKGHHERGCERIGHERASWVW